MPSYDARTERLKTYETMRHRREVTTAKKSFMDEIVDSFVTSKSDKLTFANASDGLHVFVNGEHKGYFVRLGTELVWRSV